MNLIAKRKGAGKTEPFTVLVIANPALEAPESSAQWVRDPITSDPTGFAVAVDYIDDSLFGRLPGQAEQLLGDPAIEPDVRLVTCFEPALAVSDANAFVAQDASSTILLPRRATIRDFLLAHQIVADVVFAVTGSTSHTRASSFYTSDDDSKPGDPFTLDGVTMHHRHRYLIPGTVAIHQTATSLTAAHEFSHAISSYTNGSIIDLYYDGAPH